MLQFFVLLYKELILVGEGTWQMFIQKGWLAVFQFVPRHNAKLYRKFDDTFNL
jgi:hypothetical protein